MHERNRLRDRESALKGWEGVELVTVVEWCVCVCVEKRILDLLVESSISAERSCEMIDLQA